MALFINENYFDRPDYSDFNIMEESYKFMYEQECAFNTLYTSVITEGTVGDTLKKWKDKIIEIIKNFIKKIKELFAKFKAKIKSKGKKTNTSSSTSGSSTTSTAVSSTKAIGAKDNDTKAIGGSERLAIGQVPDSIPSEDIDRFINNPTPEMYKEITKKYKYKNADEVKEMKLAVINTSKLNKFISEAKNIIGDIDKEIDDCIKSNGNGYSIPGPDEFKKEMDNIVDEINENLIDNISTKNIKSNFSDILMSYINATDTIEDISKNIESGYSSIISKINNMKGDFSQENLQKIMLGVNLSCGAVNRVITNILAKIEMSKRSVIAGAVFNLKNNYKPI